MFDDIKFSPPLTDYRTLKAADWVAFKAHLEKRARQERSEALRAMLVGLAAWLAASVGAGRRASRWLSRAEVSRLLFSRIQPASVEPSGRLLRPTQTIHRSLL